MKDLILFGLIILLLVSVIAVALWRIIHYSKSPAEYVNLRLASINIIVTSIFAAAAFVFAFQQLKINQTLSEFEIRKQEYDRIYYQERLKITLHDLEGYINHFKTFETLRTNDVDVMKEVLYSLRKPLEDELRNPQLLVNDSLRILWLKAIDVCRIIEWPEGLPETDEINNKWYNIQFNSYHRILNEIHWALYPEQLEAIKKMTSENKADKDNPALNKSENMEE